MTCVYSDPPALYLALWPGWRGRVETEEPVRNQPQLAGGLALQSPGEMPAKKCSHALWCYKYLRVLCRGTCENTIQRTLFWGRWGSPAVGHTHEFFSWLLCFYFGLRELDQVSTLRHLYWLKILKCFKPVMIDVTHQDRLVSNPASKKRLMTLASEFPARLVWMACSFSCRSNRAQTTCS